ncbi:hypothetical protein LEP1GSC188_2531 [Leptospira weilii serovar Topaz str. LT2116]|uniref:Uncharacterized protein n=1 Tax=Leptospira weilii serovar Topaz str. LT2116 TaxID=1088540 RepID=M3G2R9_9LEPT|nr:hypothetical protein LEP1GSC188_2531 [Leptospira weilii serovar Topaz str. LT2116]
MESVLFVPTNFHRKNLLVSDLKSISSKNSVYFALRFRSGDGRSSRVFQARSQKGYHFILKTRYGSGLFTGKGTILPIQIPKKLAQTLSRSRNYK